MTIPVTCPCGKKLRAKPELAGRRVKCPACGGVLVVPDPASGVAWPVWAGALLYAGAALKFTLATIGDEPPVPEWVVVCRCGVYRHVSGRHTDMDDR